MDVTINKSIATKLKHCQNLLSSMSGNSVFLTSEDRHLKILANNLDIELELFTDIEANIQAFVDGKKLYQIISQASDSEIKLSAIKKQLKIQYDKVSYQLNLIDSEYVTFPKFGEIDSIKCNLKEAIRKTAFVVADRDAVKYRPSISGLYFDFRNGVIVATDGYRLAIYYLHTIDETKEPFLVPYEAVKILEALMKDEIEISWDKTMVEFRGDDFRLCSKLMGENYPDFVKIIPKNQCSFMIDAKELSSTVNRVSLINERIVFDFRDLAKENLIISSYSEYGNAQEAKVTDYNGSDMKISLNANYLKDVLSRLDGEIRFELNDEKSAIVIRQKNYQYILMPMRSN